MHSLSWGRHLGTDGWQGLLRQAGYPPPSPASSLGCQLPFSFFRGDA